MWIFSQSRVRDQVIQRVPIVIALQQCRVQLPASHHNQPGIMRRRFIVSTATSLLFNMTSLPAVHEPAHTHVHASMCKRLL